MTFRKLQLITLVVGCSFLLYATAFGESIHALQVFICFPLGLLITAIPIAPGGVGTGHAAFSYLFQLFGSMRGADIFSLYVLSQFVLGGIGGIVYLKSKSESDAIALPSDSNVSTR